MNKINIFKCLAVILLTGCGDAFSAETDNTVLSSDAGSSDAGSSDISNAGDSGMGGEVSIGGSTAGNSSLAGNSGSDTASGGSSMQVAGSSNGGSGAGGIAGESQAGSNSAGSTGMQYTPKFCKIGVDGVAANYLCTDVKINNQPALNQADCPESTSSPPDYLISDPNPAPHPYYFNNCVVNRIGFNEAGTTNFWCCTNPIRTE